MAASVQSWGLFESPVERREGGRQHRSKAETREKGSDYSRTFPSHSWSQNKACPQGCSLTLLPGASFLPGEGLGHRPRQHLVFRAQGKVTEPRQALSNRGLRCLHTHSFPVLMKQSHKRQKPRKMPERRAEVSLSCWLRGEPRRAGRPEGRRWFDPQNATRSPALDGTCSVLGEPFTPSVQCFIAVFP